MICFGLRPVSSSPSNRTSPRTVGVMPRSASASSVCPLPWTPAIQTISPPATSRSRSSTTSVPLGAATETFSSTSRGAAPVDWAGALSTRRLTARPTISSASCASESVGRAWPTTLPRRITVILSAIARTSRSLWVMKTIARPSSRSERITSISSSISCGVSTAVGSSKIRYFASLARAFKISTRCCTPTGQLLDQRVRVDLQPIALRQLTDRTPGLPHVQQAGPAVLPAQDQVLGHGEHLDEHEVLMHHADAGGDRLLGVAADMLDAVDDDRALVRRKQPVEHVHQGRLAGPVLPQQAVDLAGHDVQVDAVIGHQRPEPLGDTPQLETSSSGGGSPVQLTYSEGCDLDSILILPLMMSAFSASISVLSSAGTLESNSWNGSGRCLRSPGCRRRARWRRIRPWPP